MKAEEERKRKVAEEEKKVVSSIFGSSTPKEEKKEVSAPAPVKMPEQKETKPLPDEDDDWGAVPAFLRRSKK